MNTRNHPAPVSLRALTSFTAVALLLFTAAPVDSQSAAELPKSPEAALTAAKAANQALLEKQRATLERLDAIQKEADQLRIFVRRS